MRNAGKALVLIVIALLAIGILLLASASSVKGMDEAGDMFFYVKKQMFWLGLGILGCIGAAFFDYHWLHKTWLNILLIAITALLLMLVFVPHIGKCIKGSYRWIQLGPMSIQPSEFAKLTIVIMLSTWMTLKGRFASNIKQGLVIPIVSLGTMLLFIFLEPDYGTTFLLAAVGAGIMFLGGTRSSHLVSSGVLALMLFSLAVMHNPVRLMRFLSFLFRDAYPDAAYQLTQSETALALGGIWGGGYMQSVQKLYFLPEAHNDFIFAILGEELGMIATLGVVVLFVMLLVFGMGIARRAPDRFGFLLAFGMTMLLSLEAFINIGVVTGCLPTKGLALPFMSAGGSSMISSMVAVGVLLNVARHVQTQDLHVKHIKDCDVNAFDQEPPPNGSRIQQT
jgi:cell division protein FtsW